MTAFVRSPHLRLVTQPDDDGGAGWAAALGADYTAQDVELLTHTREWLTP